MNSLFNWTGTGYGSPSAGNSPSTAGNAGERTTETFRGVTDDLQKANQTLDRIDTAQQAKCGEIMDRLRRSLSEVK